MKNFILTLLLLSSCLTGFSQKTELSAGQSTSKVLDSYIRASSIYMGQFNGQHLVQSQSNQIWVHDIDFNLIRKVEFKPKAGKRKLTPTKYFLSGNELRIYFAYYDKKDNATKFAYQRVTKDLTIEDELIEVHSIKGEKTIKSFEIVHSRSGEGDGRLIFQLTSTGEIKDGKTPVEITYVLINKAGNDIEELSMSFWDIGYSWYTNSCEITDGRLNGIVTVNVNYSSGYPLIYFFPEDGDVEYVELELGEQYKYYLPKIKVFGNGMFPVLYGVFEDIKEDEEAIKGLNHNRGVYEIIWNTERGELEPVSHYILDNDDLKEKMETVNKTDIDDAAFASAMKKPKVVEMDIVNGAPYYVIELYDYNNLNAIVILKGGEANVEWTSYLHMDMPAGDYLTADCHGVFYNFLNDKLSLIFNYNSDKPYGSARLLERFDAKGDNIILSMDVDYDNGTHEINKIQDLGKGIMLGVDTVNPDIEDGSYYFYVVKYHAAKTRLLKLSY